MSNVIYDVTLAWQRQQQNSTATVWKFLPNNVQIHCQQSLFHKNYPLNYVDKTISSRTSPQTCKIIQVLAPFNLHTIKGEWTAGLLSNNLSRFIDVRWPPTTPGLAFSVRKTVQSTTQCVQLWLLFRTSPQEGLHSRTTSPTLSCSCFVADSHDHLEFLQTWLSAAGR